MLQASVAPRQNYLPGLLVALFAVPLTILLFGFAAQGSEYTNKFVIVKELSIFLMTGFLIWWIYKKEGGTVASIGIHNRGWGQSLLWAFAGLFLSIVVGGCIILFFQMIGVPFGDGKESQRYSQVSLWVITLMVLRAGVVEEICYRGYAMERLSTYTTNKFVYILIPLVLFAIWHYKQGIVGITISFCVGGVLAWMYWKKRDLKSNIITHFLTDFIPNVLIPLLIPQA